MAVLHHLCYRPSSEAILRFRLYMHHYKLTASVPRRDHLRRDYDEARRVYRKMYAGIASGVMSIA